MREPQKISDLAKRMIMLKVGQLQLRIGWKLLLGLWSFVTHMGSIFCSYR